MLTVVVEVLRKVMNPCCCVVAKKNEKNGDDVMIMTDSIPEF